MEKYLCIARNVSTFAIEIKGKGFQNKCPPKGSTYTEEGETSARLEIFGILT